ncbi:MAG: diaminopimelate epimerase [Bacteroidales bacterium]
MIHQFYKYQGAGNDFILLDNRSLSFNVNTDTIEKLCDRRFGIGADGLMLLENSSEADFYMRYFNADGGESTMCGNGGRCIVAFARRLGIIDKDTLFQAYDGLHKAKIMDSRIISLQMKNIEYCIKYGNDYYVDTGSPHYVKFVEDIRNAQVYEEGKKIRVDEDIAPHGTNVNFVKIDGEGKLSLRTYERGVENETLACGTGAVASAVCTYLERKSDKTSYLINVVGGKLIVDFEVSGAYNFKNIWLTGLADYVYEGNIEI